MNRTHDEYEKIEHLLGQVRPSDASAATKACIVDAAKHAWEQTQGDVPWQVPLRRLVASAVAAVLVISLANVAGSRVGPGAGRRDPSPAATDSGDLNGVYQTEYGTIVSTLSMGRYGFPEPRRRPFSEHLRQIRELLEETESRESGGQLAPTPGRSRLMPATRPTRSWS